MNSLCAFARLLSDRTDYEISVLVGRSRSESRFLFPPPLIEPNVLMGRIGPNAGGSGPLKVRHRITTFLEALSGAFTAFRALSWGRLRVLGYLYAAEEIEIARRT